ncbi:TetR/AcrR family transcriptional regulator [Streptomyces sp. B8F3]|uniref:TetR/AcrR family transcriptional regulator n=1 Tax=Streptomyces sp. B8F3 TaxID=3153573 RepID=UPI00325E4B10
MERQERVPAPADWDLDPGRAVSGRQQAALTAAQELLLDGGWSAVTHLAVAGRSGVGRTTLYRYWPNSAILIREVLAQIFGVEHAVPTGRLRDDLIAELQTVRTMLQDPTRDRALRLLIDRPPVDPASAKVLDSCREKGSEVVREILSRAAAEGRFTDSFDLDEGVERLLGPVIFRRLYAGEDFPAAEVPVLVDAYLRVSLRRSAAA